MRHCLVMVDNVAKLPSLVNKLITNQGVTPSPVTPSPDPDPFSWLRYWMNLQSRYDMDIAEDFLSEQIAREVRPLTAAS